MVMATHLKFTLHSSFFLIQRLFINGAHNTIDFNGEKNPFVVVIKFVQWPVNLRQRNHNFPFKLLPFVPYFFNDFIRSSFQTIACFGRWTSVFFSVVNLYQNLHYTKIHIYKFTRQHYFLLIFVVQALPIVSRFDYAIRISFVCMCPVRSQQHPLGANIITHFNISNVIRISI